MKPKKTKLLSLISLPSSVIVGFIGMFLTLSSFASGSTMSLSPSSQTVNNGATFNVQVWANVSHNDSGDDEGIAAVIAFPKSRLQVTNLSASGSSFSQPPQQKYNNTNGTITIFQDWGGTKPMGNLLITTISFRALSTGNAAVSYSDAVVGNDEPATSGGTYSIVTPPAPTPPPASPPSAPPASSPTAPKPSAPSSPKPSAPSPAPPASSPTPAASTPAAPANPSTTEPKEELPPKTSETLPHVNDKKKPANPFGNLLVIGGAVLALLLLVAASIVFLMKRRRRPAEPAIAPNELQTPLEPDDIAPAPVPIFSQAIEAEPVSAPIEEQPAQFAETLTPPAEEIAPPLVEEVPVEASVPTVQEPVYETPEVVAPPSQPSAPNPSQPEALQPEHPHPHNNSVYLDEEEPKDMYEVANEQFHYRDHPPQA
jgi:hypothetical protein